MVNFGGIEVYGDTWPASAAVVIRAELFAALAFVMPLDRIKFDGESKSYTVQARSERFLVCTKPFAARRTVIYTIVDLQQKVRGPENLVFGFGAETVEQCEDMAARLQDGVTEVTHRNRVQVVVDDIRYFGSKARRRRRPAIASGDAAYFKRHFGKIRATIIRGLS